MSRVRGKRWRRRLLLVAVGWIALEALSWMGLLVMDRVAGMPYLPLRTDALAPGVAAQLDRVLAQETDYLQPDAVLGWTIRPGGAGEGLYAANSQGLRANREYSEIPAWNRLRVATFGDSFTHGDEVEFEATWPRRLERHTKGIEVLNFGVPAYGPGQAALRYKELGQRFRPHIVLIGFMAENIHRAVNVFRPYYSPRYSFPLTKPRFEIRDGELALIPNPLPALADYEEMRANPAAVLPRIGEHDFFFAERYRASTLDVSAAVRAFKVASYALWRSSGVINGGGRYDTTSEPFAVVTGVLSAFCKEVRRHDALPVIVFFPAEILPRGQSANSVYQPLVAWAKRAGHRHVDLQKAFDRWAPRARPGELQLGGSGWGHYSPAAHDIVANYLRDYLARKKIDNMPGLVEAIAADEARQRVQREAARKRAARKARAAAHSK